MQRDDLVYVHHMLETANRIIVRTQPIDRSAFDADEDRQLAVLHLIQVFGESARRVSEPFKSRHPDVPWREIVGMRTKIVHDYFETDFGIVWDVAKEKLPALIGQLKGILSGQS
ncbi:MAG: DUF86 domain-containing protein [Candidatus Sericytochromatia bacterium]|nr:DUF86 domain-containing protein [Candidatus Sericytochromatia bacterium]